MKFNQSVLFLGHGSPLNVISVNDWTHSISELGKSLRKPDGIIVISAHWMTNGLKIHFSPNPPTIHDFRGFPNELHDIRYQAPGKESLALNLKELLPESEITNDWGFDHGTWGVLHFLRPQADVPVVPLSLNVRSTAQDLFELGQKLRPLREQNLLIIGSGNLVHNLREINFSSPNEVFGWAQDFDHEVKTLTEQGDLNALLKLPSEKPLEFKRAHPTFEHWAPYVVCLGAASDISQVLWVHEGLQNGSISMRSAQWI